MVTQEQFNRSKAIIKAGWPEDRIVEEEDNKLVLKCENGAFLIYRRLVIPLELKETPAATMMTDKVMFQFTEKLEDSPYNNVSMEIAGKREAEGRVKEALKELAFRVQLGNVLL